MLYGLDPQSLKPLQSMIAGVFLREKRIMLMLPRQEGKTEFGVRVTRSVLHNPVSRNCLFLAKDKPSLKRMSAEKFQRLFPKEQFEVNTAQVYNKKNKSCVAWMESVDKEPDRLRGGTYFYIHWAEVAFSNIEKGYTVNDVYQRVIAPTLRQTNGFVLMESTPNGKNGWFEMWGKAPEMGFKTISISLSQMAEMGLCPRDDYDKLKSETHPDVFDQEYECKFVSFTGRIYHELKQSHIIGTIPSPEPWQQVCLAIDWGFTAATCVLFLYVRDGYLCVFDEIYGKEMLLDEVAEKIKQKLVDHNIHKVAAVADHDPKNIKELNLRGIPCGLADKVNVLGARLQIKESLFKNRLLIHPRCKMLVRDLEAAEWDPKKPEEIDESKCTWGHFDAEAALRYGIRQYDGFEVAKPQQIHRLHDAGSVAAWRLELEHKQEVKDADLS